MRERETQLIKAILQRELEKLWKFTGQPLPEVISECLKTDGFAAEWAELAEKAVIFLEDLPYVSPGKGGNISSIFNHLNGCSEDMVWDAPGTTLLQGICYPGKKVREWSASDYHSIQSRIENDFRHFREDVSYINVLLDILEDELFYIPAGTGNGEISLCQHVRMVIAAGTCLMRYAVEDSGAQKYGGALPDREIFGEKAFQLLSMDISGIQDFIYTISSEGALKSLRARSFYLEMMMEEIVDGLLEKLELTRANLIYSGGGHCYLLLPGRDSVRETAAGYLKEINDWLLEWFQTDLYIGCGFCPCSLQELKDEPGGSYSQIFMETGRQISEKKMRRYSAEQIRLLNRQEQADGLRECSICKRLGALDKDGHCRMCGSLINFSKNILSQEYYGVAEENREDGVPLPGKGYLIPVREETAASVKKLYRKNRTDRKYYRGRRILVGDYAAKDTLKELAQESRGIERLAVYRADVDNLGNAFVEGFKDKDTKKNQASLSRTAVLSAHLSVFFKHYINDVIAGKNAAIVYAGGDDVFVLGAWNDVLQFALDLREELEKYTQNTLTISGGIGIYTPSYPIRAMAEEAADLEDASKARPGKNSITLFSEEYGFSWKRLKGKVLGEKLRVLEAYFDMTEERGNSFLYNLLELIRESGDKVNLVRYVYLLSRMEPQESKDEKGKNERLIYQEFSKNMYRWIQNKEDREELITAIYIYVYERREK